MAYFVMDDKDCVNNHELFENITMLSSDKFDKVDEYVALTALMTDYPYYKHVDGKIHFAYQVENNKHIKQDIAELEKYHDKADY